MSDSPFKNLMPLLQLQQRKDEQNQALALAKLGQEIKSFQSQVDALSKLGEDKTKYLTDLGKQKDENLDTLKELGVIYKQVEIEKGKADFGGDAPKIGKMTFDRLLAENQTIENDINQTKADIGHINKLTNAYNFGVTTGLEQFEKIVGSDNRLSAGELTKFMKGLQGEEFAGYSLQAVKQGILKSVLDREKGIADIDKLKAEEKRALRRPAGESVSDKYLADLNTLSDDYKAIYATDSFGNSINEENQPLLLKAFKRRLLDMEKKYPNKAKALRYDFGFSDEEMDKVGKEEKAGKWDKYKVQ